MTQIWTLPDWLTRSIKHLPIIPTPKGGRGMAFWEGIKLGIIGLPCSNGNMFDMLLWPTAGLTPLFPTPVPLVLVKKLLGGSAATGGVPEGAPPPPLALEACCWYSCWLAEEDLEPDPTLPLLPGPGAKVRGPDEDTRPGIMPMETPVPETFATRLRYKRYFCRWLATFSLDRPSTFMISRIFFGTASEVQMYAFMWETLDWYISNHTALDSSPLHSLSTPKLLTALTNCPCISTDHTTLAFLFAPPSSSPPRSHWSRARFALVRWTDRYRYY